MSVQRSLYAAETPQEYPFSSVRQPQVRCLRLDVALEAWWTSFHAPPSNVDFGLILLLLRRATCGVLSNDRAPKLDRSRGPTFGGAVQDGKIFDCYR